MPNQKCPSEGKGDVERMERTVKDLKDRVASLEGRIRDAEDLIRGLLTASSEDELSLTESLSN